MAEADVDNTAPIVDESGTYDEYGRLPSTAATGFMQAPALFESTSGDMQTDGLGLLSDAIWSIKWQEGSFPTLEMEYPLNGKLAAEIKLDRIILADGGYNWKRQMFRIDSVEPDLSVDSEPIINISATHVAGDIIHDVLAKDVSLANATATQTFVRVLDSLAEPLPQAKFYSDVTKVSNISWTLEDGKTAQDIMFGRTQGGEDMESVFDGEWWFDNYTYYFNQNGGRKTDLLIKFGKNMTSYSSANSLDDVNTAIFPFAKYNPNDAGEGDQSEVTDYTGVGTIQYMGAGGLTVYDSPFKGQQPTGKTLKNGSYWKVFQQASDGTVNGHTWFGLGGSQWVDGDNLTFDKSGDFTTDIASNKAVGQGTVGTDLDNVQSKRHIVNVSGVGTISYAGKGKVALWDSPFAPNKITGKYLANGSAYKVFQQATDEKGHIWYGLGGSQWIDSSYLTFTKANDYKAPTTVSDSAIGYCTIKSHTQTVRVADGKYKTGKKKGQTKYVNKSTKVGAEVYTGPNGSKTGRLLGVGTRWKIFSVADGGKYDWYNLGSGQWVMSTDVTFDGKSDVKPKMPTQSTEGTTSSVAVVYDGPGIGGKPTGKTLPSGTQWHIFGQATTPDGTWYDLGNGQWVKESELVFSNATDVEPNSDQDEPDEVELPDVLVTLPEGILTATGAEQFERQRIVAFDASEYGVEDEDTLRQVAQAYIKDYNVGIPSYSLKVEYAEMTGKLAGLTQVGAYDTVSVYLPQLKTDSYGEVSEFEWDGNRNRNTSVTVGNRQPAITNAMQYWSDQAKNDAEAIGKNAIQVAAAELKGEGDQIRELMTQSIKNVTDSFTARANDFENQASQMHDELTAADASISAAQVKTQNGFEQYVQSTDGRIADMTQTISGIQSTVSNANGDISQLTQRADGLEAKVGDESVSSRLLAFKNEIGGQINDTATGLQNTIDQKVQDGLSSITLAVDDQGNGIQLTSNGKVSTAYINVSQAITNDIRTLGMFSMKDDKNVTAISNYGITVTGDYTPSVQVGSPYGATPGQLTIYGNQDIHGDLTWKDATGDQGAYIYYDQKGWAGSGLYVNIGGGDYLLANYKGQTNLTKY